MNPPAVFFRTFFFEFRRISFEELLILFF